MSDSIAGRDAMVLQIVFLFGDLTFSYFTAS
jgi:hypothetical protein